MPVSHEDQSGGGAFHGPKAWVASLLVGLALGALLTFVLQPSYRAPASDDHGVLVDHDESEGSGHESTEDPGDSLATLAFGPDDSTPLPIQGDETSTPGAEHGADPDGHAGDHGPDTHAEHGQAPTIPLLLCIPFVLLLGSIALMPFVNESFWHKHFPDFSFLLGGVIVAYYLLGYDKPDYTHGMSYGQYTMLHAGLEYYAFIALVGGLFVASGGLLIDVRTKGRPLANTALLAFGAVIANVVGTTGASVLLIRPFMRMNEGRLRPIHVVMFIFIVSNCGGALTPIGDPPLYLGFLKGVPFEWTLVNLWPMWLACVGMLLAIFYAIDSRIDARARAQDAPTKDLDSDQPSRAGPPVVVRGLSAMICLALIVGGVFIDPMLISMDAGLEGVPVGPTFQIIVAAIAYFIASEEIHEKNTFNLFPVKEVGLLFIGIFATMAPALGYLAAHGASLGLDSPTAYFFGTGTLSAVLDNAPTYLNFLQIAFASAGLSLTPENVHAFLETPANVDLLRGISLGAVFFGAMTYIGNGPNFMIRAIAEAGGVRMPSFFGFLLRAIVLLFPVLLVIWLVFLL